MSPPCLESQGCHLIPSICSLVILPSPVAPVFSCFSAFGPVSLPTFLAYILEISFSSFFPEIGYFVLPMFLVAFLAVGNDKLVGGKCSVLPYHTGISYVCI